MTKMHTNGGTVVESVRTILKDRGLAGFYRGWSIFFLRMAPAFAVNLVFYEQARRLLGLDYLH
jgi:hypothetical protein